MGGRGIDRADRPDAYRPGGRIGMVIRLPVKSKKAVPKYVPTAEGRRHALEFLGVAQLKPKTTWAILKKTYLPARAVGMPASSEALFKTMTSEPNFQAILLKQQYGLSVAEIPKPDEAIDALAWKLMGFEGETRKFNLENIKTALSQPGVGRRSHDKTQQGRHQAAGKELGYGE